jgi:SAM-dependent methyltransferase
MAQNNRAHHDQHVAAAIKLQSLARAYHAKKQYKSLKLQEKPHDSLFLPTSPAVIELLFNNVHLSADDHLLDIGCGDGCVCLAAIKQYNCTCTGVDIDQEVINKANEDKKELAPDQQKRLIYYCWDCSDEKNCDQLNTLIKQSTVIYLFMLPNNNRYLEQLFLSLAASDGQQQRKRILIISSMFQLTAFTPIKHIFINEDIGLKLSIYELFIPV